MLLVRQSAMTSGMDCRPLVPMVARLYDMKEGSSKAPPTFGLAEETSFSLFSSAKVSTVLMLVDAISDTASILVAVDA